MHRNAASMHGLAKRDLLRYFALMWLLARLYGAGRQQVLESKAVGSRDAASNEFSITFQESDGRGYSVEMCDNGIKVVFVKDPEEKTISVGAMVGWGINDKASPFMAQVKEFIKPRRLRQLDSSLKEVSFRCSSLEYSYLLFQAIGDSKKSKIISDIFRFFKFLHGGVSKYSEADVGRILGSVSKGEELSPKDLRIFFKEVFLRSRIMVLVYGDIEEEDAKGIREGIAGIRCGAERVLSAREKEATRAYLAKLAHQLNEDHCSKISSNRWSIMIPSISEATPIRTASAGAIADILRKKLREDLPKHLNDHRVRSHLEIPEVDTMVLNDFGFLGIRVVVERSDQSESDSDGTSDEETYITKVMSVLLSLIKKAKVTRDEYQNHIRLVEERLGLKDSRKKKTKIFHSVLTAFLSRLPPEDYLSGRFEDLKPEEIDEVVRGFLDVNKWVAGTSEGERYALGNFEDFEDNPLAG